MHVYIYTLYEAECTESQEVVHDRKNAFCGNQLRDCY